MPRNSLVNEQSMPAMPTRPRPRHCSVARGFERGRLADKMTVQPGPSTIRVRYKAFPCLPTSFVVADRSSGR